MTFEKPKSVLFRMIDLTCHFSQKIASRLPGHRDSLAEGRVTLHTLFFVHSIPSPRQAGSRGDPGTSAAVREGTAEQSERNFHLAPFVPKRQVIAEGVPDHRVGAITGRPGAKNAFLIIFLFLNIVNRMSPTPVSRPP